MCIDSEKGMGSPRRTAPPRTATLSHTHTRARVFLGGQFRTAEDNDTHFWGQVREREGGEREGEGGRGREGGREGELMRPSLSIDK